MGFSENRSVMENGNGKWNEIENKKEYKWDIKRGIKKMVSSTPHEDYLS